MPPALFDDGRTAREGRWDAIIVSPGSRPLRLPGSAPLQAKLFGLLFRLVLRGSGWPGMGHGSEAIIGPAVKQSGDREREAGVRERDS